MQGTGIGLMLQGPVLRVPGELLEKANLGLQMPPIRISPGIASVTYKDKDEEEVSPYQKLSTAPPSSGRLLLETRISRFESWHEVTLP